MKQNKQQLINQRKLSMQILQEKEVQMESYAEAKRESHLNQTRESGSVSQELEAKRAELIMTKEELKRSKDRATQSWLDSKPLTDELEKLKAGLEYAKNRSSMSNVIISDLQSQLESIIMSTKQKKEEEVKAKMKIDEINLALDQTQEEMEGLKLETDEERRERSKLKQVLRLRRQTLRTMQLTRRATRIETEAFGASAAEVLGHIKNSEIDDTKMQLSQEEYQALTRRAKEEKSLADWRVSVSTEQKLLAEASRNSASKRLEELLHSHNRSRSGKGEENKTRDGDIIIEDEKQEPTIRTEPQHVYKKQTDLPIARASLRADFTRRKPPRQSKRSKRNNRPKKTKKPSIFQQIKSFLRKITRVFG